MRFGCFAMQKRLFSILGDTLRSNVRNRAAYLLDIIQHNERCFDPELNSGLMDEEKRNASLTTRAHNKEGPDRIRRNGHTLYEMWICCIACNFLKLGSKIFDFLWHIGVSVEERQTVDIEFLAF